MSGSSFALIGEVRDSEMLEIYGVKGGKVIATPFNELKEAWQKPLRW